MELEIGVQELCLEAIKKGIVKSAHDLSDGGLAVNISESLIHSKSKIGVKLDLVRKLRTDELLFGECPSVIIVSITEDDLYNLVVLAKRHDIHTQTIGKVTDDGLLQINDKISIKKNRMKTAYFNSLEKKLKHRGR